MNGSLRYQSFIQPDATSIVRRAEPKLQESVSVADYGAVGDGVTDDSPAINKAIFAVVASGGGVLNLLNGKTYACGSPLNFPPGRNNIIFKGNGATVLRAGQMPPSTGVFDLQATQGVKFRDFTCEGNVLFPAGVVYSQFNSDPMYPLLTENTSFWIHGGSSDIDFDGVTVTHTGGYAIISDTRTGGNNVRIRIESCNFINNRPHLFGVNPADINYGSWTGGILYEGDCGTAASTFVTMGLKVLNCTFERNTGNCVWGHNYGFHNFHSSIEVVGNSFLDCGLDCIEISVTIGGCITSNSARRVGYICTNDDGPSIPRYLSGLNATFIDHSGYVEGVNMCDNSCTSICGGFCSLDGYAYGAVTGNNFRQPQVGDAYYVEDQIALIPAGVVYGLDCANTFGSTGGITVQGGAGLCIVGNAMYGCSAGAIIGIAVRESKIADNDIWQPGNSTFVPVLLGNQSTAQYQRCYSNSITGNRIFWSPATPKAAIAELENWSGGSIPWSAGDINWIEKNHIFDPTGNAFEVSLAPSSSSTTAWQLSSSVANATAAGYTTFKRVTLANGTGGYTSVLGTAGTEYYRFADSGILTVNGALGTGVVAYLFNSVATGTDHAIQSNTGSFFVTGAGDAFFQTVIATTTFNSRADLAGSPSTTAAFQTSTGTMVIFGDGSAQFQSIAVTTGITIGGTQVALKGTYPVVGGGGGTVTI